MKYRIDQRVENDPDLAPFRDEVWIAAMPEPDRTAWRKFWADVNAVRKNAEEAD